MNDTKQISEMSFEEAMNALETVVRRLESGNIKLEEAMETYEFGVKLKQHCTQKLNAAKAKIDLLLIDKQQITGIENFDEQISS